ncbi:MAG: ABC transporter substrate-binding protein [Rubrobacter sp.]|nr:ABC transporter substrate-binding protein [Rubrobacter sp.]
MKEGMMRGRAFGRRGLSRRRFLQLGGASMAGAALLGSGTLGCGGGGDSGGATELTFSLFPDPTGTVQELVDRFNEEHEGEIVVTFREMPADSGQHFDQIRTEFQSGQSSIDVIGGDVIWPAQFAANGWILDLSDRFSDSDAFLEAPIEANSFEGSIYGVPWYTDVGFLYYRQDLIDEAPATYDEMKDVAQQIMDEEGLEFGYLFQGADYEGGVVNGLEFIWNAGGDVLDGNEVVIDSPEAVRGLELERSMISDGVSPQGVSQYMEQESASLFLQGDSVFMRNVPRMYALASDPEESNIDPEQIGIAALPVAEEGIEPSSSTGGWNMFINANTEDPDAAWEFVQFMTAPEQQKFRALEGAVLPTRSELYEDEEVLDGLVIARLGQDAIQSARPRPINPFYSDMSLAMGSAFSESLNGEAPPEEVLATLGDDLQEIVDQT